MGCAYVDDVRKTPNVVLKMVKCDIGVTTHQQDFQVTHCGGVVLRVIEHEMSNLKASKVTINYCMRSITFAVGIPARSMRQRITCAIFFLVCCIFKR